MKSEVESMARTRISITLPQNLVDLSARLTTGEPVDPDEIEKANS